MNKLAVILDKMDPTQHPFLLCFMESLAKQMGNLWNVRGFVYRWQTIQSKANFVPLKGYGIPGFVKSYLGLSRINGYSFRDHYRHYPLREFSPTVIHITNPNRYGKLVDLAYGFTCKHIVSFRGSDILVFPHSQENWPHKLSRIFKSADVLHFNCRKLREEAIALGADEEKCHVIYRSVDPDFRAQVERSTQDRTIRLASVGRLVWQKDHSTLIKALKILRDQGVDCQLTFAGDGPLKDKLLFEASRLGVSDAIKFNGVMTRAELKELLGSSDFLIQSSLSEGLPNSVLEAMAMGVPVVATPVGGIPEVIEDNRTGFLFPVGDSFALASIIANVWDKTDLIKTIVANGTKTIEKSFQQKTEVAQWKSLLENLV